jgi:hypothetical protein
VSNNHRDGGHGGDGDVVRGRHHGNHRGGGSGNNYLGGGGNGGQRQRGRDNDRGGNNDDGRHDRFHGSQQQHYQQHYLQNNPHQHQQMQLHHVHHNERRGGYGHKRSLSPPHSHHDNDLQQHQNQRPIKLHREGSGGPPPPPHTPQSNQQLLSPSSNQKQPPPLLQQTPVVPPEKRRTLILSNIPSHIQYYQLQNFFRKYWNAPTQYCVLDRNSCEAYVVFKFVEDAQRVWNGGGLDGNGGDAGDASNGQLLENNDNCVSSLVALGVELRAVHFSNHVELGSESSTGRGGDNPYNRGGYSEEIYEYEGGGVGRSNGGNSFNDRRRPGSVSRSVSDVHAYHEHAQDGYAPSTKQPRYSEGHHAMDSQQHNARPGPSHVSPASSAIQLTPAANPRIPVQSTYEQQQQQQQKQQEIQLSPIELQMQQQQEAEEWSKWEAFQVQEMEWRKRRHAEYNSFTQSKNERSNQLSTLEQKRDLLSKQEHMLSQQLPLHKKMLAMLKSKNATPAEQTTKMKEILSTSKRIVELKTEMKGVIEDIEKMKEEEVILGVFRPSEKRPVFTGNVGAVERVGVAKKRSLDRRTTMLKVQGFNEAENADEVGWTNGVIDNHAFFVNSSSQ